MTNERVVDRDESLEEGAPSARAQRCGRRLSHFCGTLAGLAGVSVLVGWAVGEPRLTSISTRWPIMVPNTAASLVLASAASWLLAPRVSARPLVWTGRLAAIAVIAVGTLSLLEYAIGPIGIDELLFRLPPASMKPPGRPAANTLVALVAAGASLLLLRRRPRRGVQLSDVAACVVGVAGLAGLASYVYGAAPVYGLPGHVPQPAMALPTASALVLLGVSLLTARPDVGLARLVLSPNLGGVVVRHLLALGALFPVLGLLVVVGRQRGFYGEAVAASILTTGGVVLGLAAVTVTGLRLDALDALRKRASYEQARLAAIVESSSDAILSATLDGVVLTWNRAAERMYGYSASEVVGNPRIAAQVVPDDRRGEIPALIARVRRGERVEGFETVRRRKNGELCHVSLTMSPVLDERGRAVAISAIARDVTPRVRAEQALRAGEERYRLLFDQASDGVFVADLSGRYTDVNAAGRALLGCAREEIVGKTIVDLILPEDVPRLAASRERLLAGAVDVDEWQLRRGDGTFVPVEVSAKILPSGAWQGFVRDISERKQAEAALRRSHAAEQHLRRQLEAVMQAGLTTFEAVTSAPEQSLTRTFEVIVEQARKLTGAAYGALGTVSRDGARFDRWVYSGITGEQAERIGRHPRPVGVLAPASRATASNAVAPTLLSDVRSDERFLGFPPGHPEMQAFLAEAIRHRGRVLGHLYLAKTAGEPPFTEDDARTVTLLAARAAIAIHIAELYAEQAQKRGWLQAVVDQVPEGIILLDADGRFAAINAAAKSLAAIDTGLHDPFGNPYAYDVRLPSGEPVALDDLPLVQALVRRAITRGRELQLVRADGAVVPILTSAAPVLDEAGKVLGASLVIQDITVMKELERLREEWTGVVAHDLRQPVGIVLMSAALLERGELSERDRGHVARVRNSAMRLRTMIDDLLDASRLEADRLALERRCEAPDELLDRMLDHLEPVLGGRRILVTRQGPFQPVLVDAARVEQVLGNLLSNAVKYSEPGTDIEVALADRGAEVELGVTNRGRGIPPDELTQLFGRFKRTSAAQGSGIVGIGLGLYICKGLIEAHSGRIRAESTPGDRTRFAFTLPYAACERASAA